MATVTRTKAKAVSVVASDSTPELPDTGCWAAPSCLACPWARCVLDMSGAESRKLADALRVVRLFARPDLRAG